MKKVAIFLIPVLLMLLSCDKNDEVKLQEIPLGDWDVVEYAKYKEGEMASFIKGEPYWLLERYAQGITIANDVYYYRFGTLEEENVTSFIEKGSYSLSKDSKSVIFTIPRQDEEPIRVQAEIISIDQSRMWIKYKEVDYNLEYIFQKK